MLKKIALLFALGFILVSCGQVAEKQNESADIKLISELVAEPLAYDGQEVTIQGLITHICKHSGDKIRINQVEDADFSIMVMLQEFQPQFDPSCEGRQIKITGVLRTVVRNMDQLEEAHNHEGEEGEGCASSQEAAKKLQEKGITPDIRAFIEMKSFEYIEVSQQETGCCSKKGSSTELAEAAKSGKCC